MRMRSRLLSLLVPVMLVSGCRDHLTAPEGPGPTPGAPAPALGVVEVTISGIGTPNTTASARFPGARSGGPSFVLSPVAESDGTIQLALLSSGSFTSGSRTAGGVRYVQATFRVRNADQSGLAYGSPRNNLTFLGASTASTLGGSAISSMRRFDGSPIVDATLARAIVPTGPVYQDLEGRINSSGADALQVLTEVEAASFSPSGSVTSVFPYGFVVRRAGSSSNRTLPASPGPEQWDGLVTFAFRVPLQASSADDAYSITITFLPVDDSETRLTQSMQEQTAAGSARLRARANALGAAGVRVLPGGGYPGAERICSVRTAGTAASPTAYMVNAAAMLTARSPDPFTGAGSFVPTSSSFSATYDEPVTGQGPQTFVVNGSQRGRYFLAGGYTNDGSGTIATPTGAFFPGEEVEVVLTGGIAGPCDGARVARYRVAAGAASATFAEAPASPLAGGSGAHAIATGDFNEDGTLDLAVTSPFVDSLSILIGDGAGGFSTRTDYATLGCTSIALVTGDLDGDGDLDLATANLCTDDVDVLLGDGAGNFAPGPGSPLDVGTGPIGIALGDMNADGYLDIVTANVGSGDVSLLLGNGSGEFDEAPDSPFEVFGAASALALADLNNDGLLDVALTDSFDEELVVLLGDGAGGLDDSCACTAPIGPNPIAMAVGDFDADGNQDVVTVGDDGATVLLGDGTGAFSATLSSPIATGLPPVVSVAIGDLNGDGDLDLVVGNSGSADITVLLGNGVGDFTPTAGSPLSATDGVNFVALADLNGDGRLDIGATTDADDIRTFLNAP